MNCTKKFLATVLAALPLSVLAAATTIEGIRVEPAQIKAGETATITITGTEDSVVNCGVVLHFGDGTIENIKLTKAGMLPMTITHKYANGGEFKVMAEPKKVTSHFKCAGKNQVAMLKVVAPAPVAAPVAPPPVAVAPVAPAPVKAAPAKPTCPAGWTLAAKSVNSKTGAFRCTAKPGTALPEGKLACGEGLGYSESKAKGVIACQP
jgi:hypothetical protein